MRKLKIDEILKAVNMIAYHAQKLGEFNANVQHLLEAAAELYDEKLNESA